MENYGWSIELNPGYVLIIGNAHDAHIQLDSAYGRAVRVGLQVKDDISCAMLSEYSSSYNTLVNGKSIQRIATVKNHDFISIGDFTAYYNNGKIFLIMELSEQMELRSDRRAWIYIQHILSLFVIREYRQKEIKLQ